MTPLPATHVVILSGIANSGKDEVAKIMTETLEQRGYSVLQIALADQLKYGLSQAYDIPIENFYDRDVKESSVEGYDITHRELMTSFGDYTKQHLHKLVYCQLLSKRINQENAKRFNMSITDKYIKPELNVVIVSDVRFLHELEYFSQNYHTEIVFVNRPKKYSFKKMLYNFVGKLFGDKLHSSEYGLYQHHDPESDHHYWIENDSNSLEILKNNVVGKLDLMNLK